MMRRMKENNVNAKSRPWPAQLECIVHKTQTNGRKVCNGFALSEERKWLRIWYIIELEWICQIQCI